MRRATCFIYFPRKPNSAWGGNTSYRKEGLKLKIYFLSRFFSCNVIGVFKWEHPFANEVVVECFLVTTSLVPFSAPANRVRASLERLHDAISGPCLYSIHRIPSSLAFITYSTVTTTSTGTYPISPTHLYILRRTHSRHHVISCVCKRTVP